MRHLRGGAGSYRLAMLLLLWSATQAEAASPRTDYMLACQGCHLDDGRGFPARGVPALTDFVGNFVQVPGGREFLVQVPGSAQSSLSDQRLADLLNWMLRTFSADQLPAGFVPYSAVEVGHLRADPLVDVAGVRAGLVRRIEGLAEPRSRMGAKP